MRRKIHWKTIFIILLFLFSVLSLAVVVFSPLCLTYTGTVLLMIIILIVSYSGIYLYDRLIRYKALLIFKK